MARSVIVTGGFGVLGQAVAEAFAASGDKVARIDFAPRGPNTLTTPRAFREELARVRESGVAVNDEEISRLKKLLERGQQHYLRWLSATRS